MDDINDNAPEFVLPYPPMVMELQDPPKFVITFSARDRDTPRYGAPFNFSLPPCKENPTCKNGDLEFTMDFDPGKNIRPEVMISFCFGRVSSPRMYSVQVC